MWALKVVKKYTIFKLIFKKVTKKIYIAVRVNHY
jgi:hypothetical protein